jgi:hypothetical protein
MTSSSPFDAHRQPVVAGLQRIWLVSAVSVLGRFAADCGRLPPLGAIEAPSSRRLTHPRRSYAGVVAAVVFRLADRGYGLDQQQAQFLAGQLQRRLRVPDTVARLAVEIWSQSMRNPDRETSQDIELEAEQKLELLDTLTRVRPDGDAAAWDALREALERERAQ